MYRNALLMDESGDSGIFYITDCHSLTWSSFPRPPAWGQCLLSRRLLRPRGRHPLFTLPQSTFIQSSSVKICPKSVSPHHCRASTWATPRAFALVCHQLWQVSRGASLSTQQAEWASPVSSPRGASCGVTSSQSPSGALRPQVPSHHWPSPPGTQLPQPECGARGCIFVHFVYVAQDPPCCTIGLLRNRSEWEVTCISSSVHVSLF